jgi:hypothetical protein
LKQQPQAPRGRLTLVKTERVLKKRIAGAALNLQPIVWRKCLDNLFVTNPTDPQETRTSVRAADEAVRPSGIIDICHIQKKFHEAPLINITMVIFRFLGSATSRQRPPNANVGDGRLAVQVTSCGPDKTWVIRERDHVRASQNVVSIVLGYVNIFWDAFKREIRPARWESFIEPGSTQMRPYPPDHFGTYKSRKHGNAVSIKRSGEFDHFRAFVRTIRRARSGYCGRKYTSQRIPGTQTLQRIRPYSRAQQSGSFHALGFPISSGFPFFTRSVPTALAFLSLRFA